MPDDQAKDTQLSYALELLRGTKSVAKSVDKKAETN